MTFLFGAMRSICNVWFRAKETPTERPSLVVCIRISGCRGGARHCGCGETGTDRLSIAATSKLDPGPEQHHMPQHALAVGLAPHYQPAVAPRSERQRLCRADELGLHLATTRRLALHRTFMPRCPAVR